MKKVKRLSPLAEIAAVNEQQEQEHKEVTTARVANLDSTICPICKSPLRACTANGIPVLACVEHRICQPRVD